MVGHLQTRRQEQIWVIRVSPRLKKQRGRRRRERAAGHIESDDGAARRGDYADIKACLAPIAFYRCLFGSAVAGSVRSLVWWGNPPARHNFFFFDDPLRGTL